jgi:hypothetical protein
MLWMLWMMWNVVRTFTERERGNFLFVRQFTSAPFSLFIERTKNVKNQIRVFQEIFLWNTTLLNYSIPFRRKSLNHTIAIGEIRTISVHIQHSNEWNEEGEKWWGEVRREREKERLIWGIREEHTTNPVSLSCRTCEICWKSVGLEIWGTCPFHEQRDKISVQNSNHSLF